VQSTATRLEYFATGKHILKTAVCLKAVDVQKPRQIIIIMKDLFCVFGNVKKFCKSKCILQPLHRFSHNLLLFFPNKLCSSQLELFLFSKIISQMLFKSKCAIMFHFPWERVKSLFSLRNLLMSVVSKLGHNGD